MTDDPTLARWSAVIGPNEAPSWWQPLPSRGHVSVALSPENTPYDGFSAGLQVLPPGCSVREHGHQRNHELLFIHAGAGTCTIEGVSHDLVPGSIVLFGRHARHLVENTGEIDMEIFWVFMPPGLEDWFAAIGRSRQAGEPMPDAFNRPENVGDIQARLRFVPPR